MMTRGEVGGFMRVSIRPGAGTRPRLSEAHADAVRPDDDGRAALVLHLVGLHQEIPADREQPPENDPEAARRAVLALGARRQALDEEDASRDEQRRSAHERSRTDEA